MVFELNVSTRFDDNNNNHGNNYCFYLLLILIVLKSNCIIYCIVLYCIVLYCIVGHVRRETLVKIIKQDFGLTIDIEELINKVDSDGSGEIEFDEFKTLLT